MKKILIAGVAIVFLVGAVWMGRPFYRQFKEKRFVAQAEAELKKGDASKAALFARQALHLNPTNPAPIKILADLAELSNSPQTLAWRQRLAQSSPTLENRIALGTASLRYESPPHPIAEMAVRDLAAVAKSDPAYLRMAADLALKQGNFSIAETRFEELLRVSPTNEAAQVHLAVLQLHSADRDKAAAAREVLERLQASPEHGLRALRSLLENSLQRNDLETAEGYSQKVLANPRSAFVDRVVHLTILGRTKSSEFEPFLLSVKTQSSGDPEQIYKLVSWMNLNELSASALDWIKSLPPEKRAAQPVPVAEADCYARKMDWRQLEAFLNEQKWGDREFIRAALLSRALREQKQKMAADVQWQRAIRLALEKIQALTVLVSLAEEWRWPAEVESTLWAILEKHPRESWVSRTLSEKYYSLGNTRGLQKLYSYLVQNNPDPGAENNLALVSLLLGVNLDKAHEMAERVFKKDPKNPSFLSTYAYSLHLKKRDAEALALFEQLSRREIEDPSIAVYYGVILASAGQNDEAKKYFKLAAKAPVLPEERKLLTEAQGRQ